MRNYLVEFTGENSVFNINLVSTWYIIKCSTKGSGEHTAALNILLTEFSEC